MSNPLHPVARVASLDVPAGAVTLELRAPMIFRDDVDRAAFLAHLQGAGADVTALIAAIRELESYLRTDTAGVELLTAGDARSLDINPTATTTLKLPEIADIPAGAQVGPGRVFVLTHIGLGNTVVIANSLGVALAELLPGDRIRCTAATSGQLWTLAHDAANQPFTRHFFFNLASTDGASLWTPRVDTLITRAWLRVVAAEALTDPSTATLGISSGGHTLASLTNPSGITAGSVIPVPIEPVNYVANAGGLITLFVDNAATADLMLCELIVEAVHL